MLHHFTATLRQHYRLPDAILLVLADDYVGDVGRGDRLAIDMPSGTPYEFVVYDVAWGTAFHANQVPITLVVKDLGAEEPATGAALRGLERAAPSEPP